MTDPTNNVIPFPGTGADGLPAMTDDEAVESLLTSDSPTPDDTIQMLSAKVADISLQNMKLIGFFNGLVENFNQVATRHNQLEDVIGRMGQDLFELRAMRQDLKNLDGRIQKALRNGASVLYLPNGGIATVGERRNVDDVALAAGEGLVVARG